MSIKNVVLLGANGKLGPSILHALVSHNFIVTVLKRGNSESSSKYPEGVRILTFQENFEEDQLAQDLTGQDALVIAIKGTQTAIQKRVAIAAAKAGIHRCIPADFGSCASEREEAQQLVPLYKAKCELRSYLQELADRYDDFTWTSLVPGHFFDWSLDFIHIFLNERKADILEDGKSRFSISTLGRIAEATCRVLERPEQTRNQILYVQSFCVSQMEIIDAFEAATACKWNVTSYEAKRFVEEEKRKAEAGSAEAVEELVWYLGTFGTNWELRKGFAMDTLGLENEDLYEVVYGIVTNAKGSGGQ